MIQCICRDIKYFEVVERAEQDKITINEALALITKERTTDDVCGRCDGELNDSQNNS